MTIEPLRIGIAGVGHLGSLHAKILAEIPEARLVGVFDIDQAKAQSAAATNHTLACKSLEELVDLADAVTVATTTGSHAEVARHVLRRKRHLFIEKPITQTVSEAVELIEMARQNAVMIQVGHIERFNPAILALERYTLRPMFVESHRLDQFNPRGTDVAVVLDLMIHDIDIILSFVKSPVARIDANGVAVVSDSVDIANARIQFENGSVANVTASRISQKRMRKMRLFQPNEYISIDFSEGTAEVFRLLDGDDPGAIGTLMLGELGSGSVKRKIVYEQPEVKEVNALKLEIELFVRAIREGTAPVVGGEDGKRALEVAQTIIELIKQQPLAR
jgi:predicted dehydrogenase